jgi:hypothetical protein
VELKYNCKDQLVWVRSPVCGDFPWGRITQFCYTTDVNPLLTNNLTWITSPAGDRWLEVRYDGSDRVSRQYVGSTTSYWSFTYGTGTTTVVDPVGNQRIWSYSGPTPDGPLGVQQPERPGHGPRQLAHGVRARLGLPAHEDRLPRGQPRRLPPGTPTSR